MPPDHPDGPPPKFHGGRDILAIDNLCRQFPGATREDAAAALDHFAAEGKSHITGDQRDVYLIVNDQVHIHCERDWLRWAAFQAE
ncbi:MAG TPA: hypothetical protein VIJ32_05040, partial [Actinomycetes bacterium]